MRDLAFVAFLLGFAGLGLKRPFLLVLLYVYIDIVSPQRLTYWLLNTVPVSFYAVLLAVGGWLVADDKAGVRVAPRQLLIVALLGYCYATTLVADFPLEARDKWEWAWKALAFAAFLPLTLRTRLRIEALLLFMILSAGSIVIVGGIKTLATGGGGYGELNLMVDNNSGLYESSTISAVSICIIPVIGWLMRFGTVFPPDWRVRLFGAALIFACLLIPVGTSARTGLVCVALLALVTLRTAKHRARYLALIAAAGLVAVPLLPSAFTERMDTIRTYQGDSSASTRIAVWKWTLDYVGRHPFGGGFDAFRGNNIRYATVRVEGTGPTQRIANTIEVDKARAYHSAYFEMLGEQGWPGLALWLLIHLGGLIRMEVIRRRHRTGEEQWAGALATALQHAHLVYLTGAAFAGIALNPFVYMLVGAQIGLDTYLARRRAAAGMRPWRAPAAHRPPSGQGQPA